MEVRRLLLCRPIDMEHTTLSGSATIDDNSAPGITIIRFRKELKLNTAVLTEIMLDKHSSSTGTQGVIMVIPEHTDFDAHIMDVDHHAANIPHHTMASLAVVCHAPELVHLLRLYFAYYPPTFEVKYFSVFHKAYDWLVERARVPPNKPTASLVRPTVVKRA